MLREALTHQAYTNDYELHTNRDVAAAAAAGSGGGGGKSLAGGRSYERLEWLGDRVLYALTSVHMFYASHATSSPYTLSKRRVPGEHLADRPKSHIQVVPRPYTCA